jgi:hypothetical protein
MSPVEEAHDQWTGLRNPDNGWMAARRWQALRGAAVFIALLALETRLGRCAAGDLRPLHD